MILRANVVSKELGEIGQFVEATSVCGDGVPGIVVIFVRRDVPSRFESSCPVSTFLSI